MNEWMQWHQQRINSVQGEQGDLLLIAMHEITTNVTVLGVPGIWSKVSEHEPGLRVIAQEEDRLMINGTLIVGEHIVVADETTVQINDNQYVTATYQPGSLHLLALWDKQSEYVQAFQGISTFNYEDSLKITAKWHTLEDDQSLIFEHSRDEQQVGRVHQSIGKLCFDYNGEHIELRPFASGDKMIVVFRDTTSGHSSYGMGRMLVVEHPQHSNQVELDFNTAFLPPCAFSPHFNCPMPPASNRLQFPIEAGEREVLWRKS